MSGILYKLLEWDIGKDPVEYSQQIRPLIEKERLRQEELTEKGITIGRKEKKILSSYQSFLGLIEFVAPTKEKSD
nr:hypothetical protein pmam_368 [Pithovirus mammoth]